MYPPAKRVFITLRLRAVALAAGAGIYKKILESGASGCGTTTLVISNE